MRNLRRLSQVVCLVAFLWLLLHTELPRDRFDVINEVPAPVDLFFQIDPLHLISTTLSTRQVHTALLWGLATLAVTALLGRVFCGWVCPMGALSQFAGWLRRRFGRLPNVAQRMASSPRQRWKYIILILMLVCAALGVNQVGLMDPISLTFRSFTAGIFPALERGLTSVFEASPQWLSAAPLRWCRDHLFAFDPVHYRQGALLGGIFLALLACAMIVPRMWCRWLCPLGALLGLFTRHQVLRVRISSELCSECGLCHRTCEGAADPHIKDGWLSHECLMCWNCVPSCPSGGISISLPKARMREEPGIDIGRRRLIGALAAGAIVPPLLRAPMDLRRVDPQLIRPPGSRPEPEFLSRCVKCAECIKVCPTNFLQVTGLEAGLEGLWTPVGVGTHGYCEYECTLCGQVCPTEAIEELDLETKQQTRIGLAFVDTDRCLPWAFDIECLVCEEHCPTPVKAIEMRRGGGRGPGRGMGRGGEDGPARPHVRPDLCIGCAICTYVCPVVDQPAIIVTSVGESRSESNQMLLDTGGASDPYS
jgi:polyferredoxin/formate hydrogenlyase subunit 6/NADH:ubiquinone oxidoreductase subunit I